MSSYSPSLFTAVIDHTFLKTEKEGCSLEKQRQEIKKLVAEAHAGKAFSVCVREHQVAFTASLLKEMQSTLKITSVIGFPLGDNYSIEQKKELFQKAQEDGAHEFDMVMRYNDLKSRKLDAVYNDIYELARMARYHVLKVIFENCYLTHTDKELAYGVVRAALWDAAQGEASLLGRRFFKTSTGFGEGPQVGATLEDVALMHRYTRDLIGIKPAGGVRNLDEAIYFFKAAGSPWLREKEAIDPYRFRIGSSSLLSCLMGATKTNPQGEQY